MSEKRLELKVGIFVLIGLALLGVIMLAFSKGQPFFQDTYTVYLKTTFVGGLKRQAQVMLSGVPVGRVEEIELSPDGRSATVALKLQRRYKIHADADFTIDALGFLGDQYVAIRPTEDKAPVLKGGEAVEGKEPFDIQELARAALGFVNRIDRTAQTLNDAIARIDRTVLSEKTLGNLSLAFSNVLAVSQRAMSSMDTLAGVFETNKPALNTSMSNIVEFSERLNTLTGEVTDTVATNRTTLTLAMNNLEQTTFTLKEIIADVNAGEGAAGKVLKDPQLELEIASIIGNLNDAIFNLNVLTSNINNRGLWSVIRKPKKDEMPQAPPSRQFEYRGR